MQASCSLQSELGQFFEIRSTSPSCFSFPEVREYIRFVIETLVNEWGYKLLKLDFLYAACIVARKDKSRGQLMQEAMEFLRDCAGDAMILACGVPLASAFGIADYCRIGCDVSLDWNDKPPCGRTFTDWLCVMPDTPTKPQGKCDCLGAKFLCDNKLYAAVFYFNLIVLFQTQV